MAIKRGPDGIPVDTPSIKYRNDDADDKTQGGKASDVNVSVNAGEEPTIKSTIVSKPSAPDKSAGSNSLFLDDPPTVPARSVTPDVQTMETQPIEKPPGIDEPQTVIAGSRAGAGLGAGTGAPSVAGLGQVDAMADPISGWLVVVDGPGQGNFLKLGYGQNGIGRSESERVSLDFGDDQISRNSHATVTYDPRGKQFYLQPGSGKNLTYLQGENTPILAPTVLQPFSHILLGNTTLRFVPFCGEDFSWDE